MKQFIFALTLSAILYSCGPDNSVNQITTNETLLYSLDSVTNRNDTNNFFWLDNNSTQTKFHIKLLLFSNDSIPGASHVHIIFNMGDGINNEIYVISRTYPNLNTSIDTTITLPIAGKHFANSIFGFYPVHIPPYYLTIKNLKLYKVN